MSSIGLYREVIEIESSPEPDPPVVGIGRQSSTSNPNTGHHPSRHVGDVVPKTSFTQIRESQVPSRFPSEPQFANPTAMQSLPSFGAQPALFDLQWMPSMTSMSASHPQGNPVVMNSLAAPGGCLPPGTYLIPQGLPTTPFAFIPPAQHEPAPTGLALHPAQLYLGVSSPEVFASQPPPIYTDTAPSLPRRSISDGGVAGAPSGYDTPMSSVRGDNLGKYANVNTDNSTGSFQENIHGRQTTVASRKCSPTIIFTY